MAVPFDAPADVDVDVIEIDGETLVVFSWSRRAPAARVLAPLTEAERAVVEGICAGRSNAAIAAMRGTSVRTVANQVASLLRKLGVGSRHELVAKMTTRS